MLSFCCAFTLFCSPFSSDIFKNAMKLGTFPAILVTYTASALLHVSKMMHILSRAPKVWYLFYYNSDS